MPSHGASESASVRTSEPAFAKHDGENPRHPKIWLEPFVVLRAPCIFNLRMDPYERALDTSNTYDDWHFRHIYLCVPAQVIVSEFLATFKEFPPRQKSASFSLDQVIEKMTEASGGGSH